MFKAKESPFEPLQPERTAYPETGAAGGGSTQIASGAKIRGDLDTPGSAVIDGRIEGSLTAEGDVQIGSKGMVEGEVEARNVTISGNVKGKVFAEEKVVLLSGAHVEGDIHATSLKIDDAVFFQGGCVMGEGARRRHGETGSSSSGLKLAAA
jgi:cytoskeletal protein CcmA (bactofilin family)